MKPNRMKRMIVGAFAAVLLMSGALIGTAEAQGRFVRRHNRPARVIVYRPFSPFWHRQYDPFWDPFPTSYRVVDPIGYQREQGYSEGRSEGKDDAKKGLPADPTGHKAYLKSKSLAFREAFIQGYNERYHEEIGEVRREMRQKRGE